MRDAAADRTFARLARGPFPNKEVNPSAEQQPVREGCLLLPATLLATKNPLFLLFFSLFLALRALADSQCSAHAIDLADAHTQAKPLLEQRLDRGTCRMGSAATILCQEGSSLCTKLAGMTVPSILQSSFAPLSYDLE